MQPKQVYKVTIFANKKFKGYKTKWVLFRQFEDTDQYKTRDILWIDILVFWSDMLRNTTDP